MALKAVDLFCGAGGTTYGAHQSGKVEVKLAINHWRPAVYSHQANHPDVRHICAEIDRVDPREFTEQDFRVVMASPECIFHSNARGGRPVDDQRRATAWCVPRWAETLKPDWLVVENVREFADWGPLGCDNRPLKSRRGEIFQAWVQALRAIGYHVEWKLLNAADYGGATRRIRLFLLGRRGRSQQPIRWPMPTHTKETWTPAWSIINWSRPCPSIFGRKRPLADKTLRRIEIGLQKFCSPDVVEPFIVRLRRNATAASVGEPIGTVTAGAEHHALAMPFVVQYHGGNHPTRNGTERQYSMLDPLPTVDTQPRYAMATPFLVPNFGERNGQEPRTHDVGGPLPAVTGHGPGHLVLPFLTEYFGTGGVRSVDEPLSTLTTKHRHGLAMVSLVKTMNELGIVDVGFRMLDVDELAAAQGFPTGYHLHGNKAEQIKQVGNSVHTHVARVLCDAIGKAA